jgi:hypothetical protein
VDDQPLLRHYTGKQLQKPRLVSIITEYILPFITPRRNVVHGVFVFET